MRNVPQYMQPVMLRFELYCHISNITGTNTQNFNVSRLALQVSLAQAIDAMY